jgi:hypothetical protein
VDLEERLSRVDEDVGSLTRETLREMRSPGEWRDPLIRAAEEHTGHDYGVAKKHVTNDWLDAYRFFRDKGIDDEAARVYYSTATVANEYLPDTADLSSTIYG